MAICTRKPSRGVSRVEDFPLDTRQRRFEIWRRARDVRQFFVATRARQRKDEGRAPERDPNAHVMSPRALRRLRARKIPPPPEAGAQKTLGKPAAGAPTELRPM